MGIKICVICGSGFTTMPHRGASKSCSSECRYISRKRTEKKNSLIREQDPVKKEKHRASTAVWQATNRARRLAWKKKRYRENADKNREYGRDYYRRWIERAGSREKSKTAKEKHRKKVYDLIAVLRAEMPDLLKEFGL